MNRTELLKRVGNILLRTPSLWVVTLIGVLVQLLPNFVLKDQSIASGLIQTTITFIITAFTAGALIGLVNLAVKQKQAATTASIDLASPSTEQESASIVTGIQFGLRPLLKLLLMSLIVMIPNWIIVFFASGSDPAALFGSFGQPDSIQFQLSLLLSDLSYFLSIAGVLFIITLVTSALMVVVQRAVVLDNLPVIAAFKYGWSLLRTKIGDFITWGLIMVLIPFALDTLTVLIVSGLLSANLDGIVVGTIYRTLQVISGLLITVSSSAIWTLVYREWQNPTVIEAAPDEKRVSKGKVRDK